MSRFKAALHQWSMRYRSFDSFSIEADESQYQEKLYELRTKAHDYSRFNEQIGKRAKTKADYEKAKASLDEYLRFYGYDSAAEYTQALSQMKSSSQRPALQRKYGQCASEENAV